MTPTTAAALAAGDLVFNDQPAKRCERCGHAHDPEVDFCLYCPCPDQVIPDDEDDE